MFKLRNLLAVGIAVLLLMAVMIPLAGAQPVQQATDTPVPTVADTATPEATAVTTATLEPTATSVAPAVSPLATPSTGASSSSSPVSTPSTLPTTGGSDDSAVMLSLLAIVMGVAVLLGAAGLAMSRRRTR